MLNLGAVLANLFKIFELIYQLFFFAIAAASMEIELFESLEMPSDAGRSWHGLCIANIHGQDLDAGCQTEKAIKSIEEVVLLVVIMLYLKCLQFLGKAL